MAADILSALGTAITLTKRLREISKNIEAVEKLDFGFNNSEANP